VLNVTVYALGEGKRQPAIINAIVRIKTREKNLFTRGSFKIGLADTINIIKSKMQPLYKEENHKKLQNSAFASSEEAYLPVQCVPKN